MSWHLCAPLWVRRNICILWNWISTLGKNTDTRWTWIFLWRSKVVKHLSPNLSFNQPNHIIINTFTRLTIICINFILWNVFEDQTWSKTFIRLAASKAGVVSVAEYARSWSQEVSEMSAKATLPKCYQATFSAQEHSAKLLSLILHTLWYTLMSVWSLDGAFNEISV